MKYPPREPFYSHRYTRLLFKSCAAQSIGKEAVLLCIHIAHTEDAAKYQGPVRFWNTQLNEVLGFNSPKSLNNARMKAVAAGWLHYERRNNRSDGNYWTLIPDRVARFNDAPIEEGEYTGIIPSTERFDSRNRSEYGMNSGKIKCSIPIPVPEPISSGGDSRGRFIPPSVEEVRKYCFEMGSVVDPEEFVDYYVSVDWKIGGKARMKDWKAAVRNWGRKPGRKLQAASSAKPETQWNVKQPIMQRKPR